MSLGRKLSILFVTLALGPMLVAGHLAYDRSRQAIEVEMAHHLMSMEIHKGDELNRWLASASLSMQQYAQRPLVQQHVALLVSSDPSGPAFQGARQHLLDFHLSQPVVQGGPFRRLSVVRASDGLILLSTDPGLEGRLQVDEPLLAQCQAGVNVFRVSPSPATTDVSLCCASPVEGAGGEVIATLVGELVPDPMDVILKQGQGLSASEQTYLVDSGGLLVSHPRLGAGYDRALPIVTTAVSACLSAHNTEPKVAFYSDFRGVPVLGATLWMPDADLCLVTEISQAEAFASVAELRGAILRMSGVVALVMAALGLIFSRSLTGPLRRLVDAAESIARGALDQRIESGSRDEIGQLASSFNDMAASLRSSQALTAHGQNMLLALGRAAQATQRARSPVDVVDTVGREIASLGYLACVLTPTFEPGHLAVRTFAPAAGAASTDGPPPAVASENVAVARGSKLEAVLLERRVLFAPDMGQQLAECSPDLAQRLESALADLSNDGAVPGFCAPLAMDEGRWGLLVTAGADLRSDDAPAMDAFAQQAAVALDHARLNQEAQLRSAELTRSVAELSALNALAEVIVASSDLDALLRGSLEQAVGVLGGDAALYWAHDPETGAWTVAGHRGMDAALVRELGQVIQDPPSVGPVPVVLDELDAGATANAPRLALAAAGYRSLVVAPVEGSGGLMGVLFVASRRPAAFAAASVELLTNMGRLISTGVQNALLNAQIRQREERFHRLTETLDGVVYRSALNTGESQYAASGIADLYGCSYDEWMADEELRRSVCLPEDRPAAAAQLEELRRARQPGVFSYRIRRKDGDVRWVDDHVNWELDDSGSPIAQVGVRYDVTDAHNIMDRVLRQGALLRAQSIVLQQAVRATDDADLATVCLQEALDLTSSASGYLLELAPPPGKAGIAISLPAWADRTGAADRTEALLDHARRAGLADPVLASGQPVFVNEPGAPANCTGLPPSHPAIAAFVAVPWTRDGAVVGLLALANKPLGYSATDGEDIGNLLVALEEALGHQRALGDLALAQERLARQERLALLGQLAGGVSHELRNPLGAIKNATYLMRMTLPVGSTDPDTMEALHIIEQEIDSAEHIISSLLGFAQPRAPDRRPTQVERLVEGALARSQARGVEGVEVVTQLEPALPLVMVDLVQMDAVLTNLIVNAVQAMPEGGRLQIEARAAPGAVEIAVSDTGVGMAPEALAMLFEPLYTTKAKGIGLGLPTSKMLVEAHGGTIQVHSEVGRGSTFVVRLPLEGTDRPPKEAKAWT